MKSKRKIYDYNPGTHGKDFASYGKQLGETRPLNALDVLEAYAKQEESMIQSQLQNHNLKALENPSRYKEFKRIEEIEERRKRAKKLLKLNYKMAKDSILSQFMGVVDRTNAQRALSTLDRDYQKSRAGSDKYYDAKIMNIPNLR